MPDVTAARDILKYLISDPSVAGAVGWAGLLFSVIGFAIAIDQILRVKSAAEAAKRAADRLTAAVFSRERLIEIGSAIAHIDNARDRITQGRYEGALVFVDFALTECVQIHELIDVVERKKFYKFIVRLRKLGEDLSLAQGNNTEADSSLALALEARAIAGVLHEMAAKLRYSYNQEGTEG